MSLLLSFVISKFLYLAYVDMSSFTTAAAAAAASLWLRDEARQYDQSALIG